MTKSEIRTALKAAYDNVRITRDGEIHVFGVMPNTNQTGWYLYGRINSAETLAHIESL